MPKTTSKVITEAKRIVKDTERTYKLLHPNASKDQIMLDVAIHLAKENIRLKENIK